MESTTEIYRNLFMSSEPAIYYGSVKESKKIEAIKEVIVNMVTNKKIDFKINYDNERPDEQKDDFYRCDRKPRGVVCLLNVKFEGNRNRERVGSEVDEENIKILFKKMGYKVVVIEQNELMEIKKEIEIMKNSDVLEKTNIFIMFLMSHGVKDHLLDVNDKEMNIMDVFVTPFSSANCPALIDKPKLFFIQACRGDRKGSREMIPGQLCLNTTHPFSDLFIFFSTPEYYLSARDDKGAIFIRSLLLTISHFCHKQSLDFIAKIVIGVMTLIKLPYEKKTIIQIPQVLTTLNKEVFFNHCLQMEND